jgi:hypothetical protein
MMVETAVSIQTPTDKIPPSATTALVLEVKNEHGNSRHRPLYPARKCSAAKRKRKITAGSGPLAAHFAQPG